MNTTIRSHLEAIIDLHQPYPMEDTCIECNYQPGPCPTREHAVAALAQLDEAVIGFENTNAPLGYQSVRFVPDPVGETRPTTTSDANA